MYWLARLALALGDRIWAGRYTRGGEGQQGAGVGRKAKGEEGWGGQGWVGRVDKSCIVRLLPHRKLISSTRHRQCKWTVEKAGELWLLLFVASCVVGRAAGAGERPWRRQHIA
jgi:hypothetical protein